MGNNRGYIIHKANHHKKGRRHDYNFYKKYHPCTPKQVVNVLDFGYRGVEKDFPEQLSTLPYKKGKSRVITRRKRVQQNSFKKEDSNRVHHQLSIENYPQR